MKMGCHVLMFALIRSLSRF